MSKQDIEKRLGFAAQGVKAEMATPMRGGEFDQAKSFLNQVSSGFNIESLKESLVGAKEVARFAPQYKALGQKLVDGINMVMSAVKQMKAESMKASRPGVKAKFGRFSTEFGFLANQIKNQPDLAKKNIIVLAKKMGDKSDITIDEFEQLVEYAEKLGMGSQVINAYDSVHPGFSRSGVKKASTDFDLAEACWEGYEAVGTKKKDGKTVPNCVPKKKAARSGVKATFAEFNVGDKVVYIPDSRHIDAYGRIIKIENGIATIASAEGNVKAKLSDLELVKKGSVEDLRRLGMKGFARPGVKAEFYASPEHLPMILAKTRKMHEDSKKAAEKYLQSGSVANQGGAAGLANSMVNSLERDLKNDLYRLTQSRNPVHKKAAKEAYAEIKAMADWWYSQYKKWTASRPGSKAKA